MAKHARKYSDEYLTEVAALANNMINMMKIMGYISHSGAVQTHLKRRLINAGIDLSHWVTGNTGKKSPSRSTPDDVFVVISDGSLRRTPSTTLRRCLVEVGVEYKCLSCGVSDWNNAPLTLQVDHIDGNWRNNELYNLRFLCPNCHTQTETWGKK